MLSSLSVRPSWSDGDSSDSSDTASAEDAEIDDGIVLPIHTLRCCCGRCRYDRPKKWAPGLLKRTFYRRDNPYGKGHCWHCGKQLSLKDRGMHSSDAWEMDHWPVPFRDIEGQLWCGVTDARDPSNLVPSCRPCNRSHNFEPRYFLCCGRAQLPCDWRCLLLLSCGSGAMVVLAVISIHCLMKYE